MDGVSYTGVATNVEGCKCPSTTPYWNGTACQATAEGASCYTQDECGGRNSEYYCKITGYSISSADLNCYNRTKGTCQKTSDVKYTDAMVMGLGTVRRSNGATLMTWWSANNWCLAQGKSLIDVEDFQVYRSGTDTLVVKGSTWSYGCAQGKTCGNWSVPPYNQMWNGNTLTEVTDENGEKYQDKYSAVMKDLRVKFNTDSSSFWTKSSYLFSSPNTCHVFYVSPNGGYVSHIERQNQQFNALCK